MGRILSIHLLLFLFLVSEAWAEVVVIMRREAEAAGNYVRICDIARVEGPRDQASEVAMIVLGRTPGRGEVQEFTRWDIESRLYEMGVRARVIFSGNDLVKVFAAGAGSSGQAAAGERLEPIRLGPDVPPPPFSGRDTASLGVGWNPTGLALPPPAKPNLPQARVRESAVGPEAAFKSLSEETRTRIGKTVSEFLSGKYARADIEVETKLLALDAAIPPDVHEVKVDDAVGGQVPGKATLRLAVRDTAEAEPRLVTVSAETSVFGLAPVAARQLNRGEVLDRRDVIVARVRMDSGKGYLPPNAQAVAGRETKRSFKAGEPITAVDAVPAEAVKRGDLVVVETNGRGWQITSTAKALGSGMVEDIITVEDVGNKTKYSARITDRGVVSALIKRDKLNKK